MTPGPWKIDFWKAGDNRIKAIKSARSGNIICVFLPSTYRTKKISEEDILGNATLIASSPLLLAVLEEAVSMNVPNDPGSWIRKAKKAIADAKGISYESMFS